MSPARPSSSPFDVIVIGAGAAGLMCALTAGQRGLRVLLLEHNAQPGLKIGISGGGRCNFTNIHAAPEHYLSGNAHFHKSALARYTPADFVALVREHGIAFHEKKLGQLFCDGSSRAIIEMLLKECAAGGVDVCCGCRVQAVRKPERFVVETNAGIFEARSLVVATGGLSFAKLGASDFGFRIAEQFGLRITPVRPGLVPLTFSEPDRVHFHELSGVALPVCVRHRGAQFGEAMLITHRGLSGPAILQISSYWREGETVEFDLLPEHGGADWLLAERHSPAGIQSMLERHWPRRFAAAWCARHAPAGQLGRIKTRDLEAVAGLAHAWPLSFSGTEGYPKAEVTLGGVDTRDLSSKTMEARAVPGLFFIGEVVDVTGWLGGYNFQWAWASGHAAGEAV